MIILGAHPEALAYARRRGIEAAGKASVDELRSDFYEECRSWGYDPRDVFGKAWIDGWLEARNNILGDDEKELA